MKSIRLIIILFFCACFAMAQPSGGVKGTISNAQGELLSFATIYVKSLETGTAANMDGYYKTELPPGSYELVYNYLGYKSYSRSIEVGTDYKTIDVVLESESMVLREVEVNAAQENPAYTIMRKAIAKSKFHRQQLDAYQAEVYIKGSGRLKDAPFFLRKKLKKEGIDSTAAFTMESVSKVSYRRPDHYEEEVISVRKIGDGNGTEPIRYINGSFYDAKIGGAISPLSPKAFSYYKFDYIGTFQDRGFEVSKIRVIPRSGGDNVFKGLIYIVEDYWSIHSLRLKTTSFGIDIDVQQVYAPIEEQVWMPISHRYMVEGSYLGFDFEYGYLATVGKYKIILNKVLNHSITVIDEKLDKELAQTLESDAKTKTVSVQQHLSEGKEVTRKQLRQLIKEYEKEERKKEKESNVITDHLLKIDSSAYDRDSSYWKSVRSVPLTELEENGYRKADSMAVAQAQKNKEDSLKIRRGKFTVGDLLFGNSYKIGKKSRFNLEPLKPHFNTVEGWNFTYTFSVSKRIDPQKVLRLGPQLRYAAARKQLSGTLDLGFDYGKPGRKGSLLIKGGRYIRQFNPDRPIHPFVNDFTTLLLEQNYMKLYERDFVQIMHQKKISDVLEIATDLSWTNRRMLDNASDFKLNDRSSQRYTSNRPESAELASTAFPEHKAFAAHLGLSYSPWLKYQISDGKKLPISNSSPEFSIGVNKAFGGILGGDVDFTEIEMGFRHGFDIGIRGELDIALNTGMFLQKEQLYFMDYKHFQGNLSPFQVQDPVGSYRLLDYYRWSTSEAYLSSHLNYQFRKFLVTRIPLVRLMGIRESVLVNYLTTDRLSSYMEMGYGINYIFKIFRLEGIFAWEDGSYKGFGVRVGISTYLDKLF